MLDITFFDWSRFVDALASGEKPLTEILKKSEKGGIVKGSDAFLLYDTFGFPLEITMDAASEQNIKVRLSSKKDTISICVP